VKSVSLPTTQSRKTEDEEHGKWAEVKMSEGINPVTLLVSSVNLEVVLY